jgi:hypothetical protein
MAYYNAVLVALAIGAGGASAAFVNVTQLGVTSIAFGSAATSNGVDMFVPGSNGGSVGVYESFNGGASVEYDSSVGQTAGAAILMSAAATSDADSANTAVLVAGLGGAALKSDAGWVKTGPKGLLTQDVKYNPGSGLLSMTGNVAGAGACALLSADRGATFTAVPVSGLFEDGDLRYGSYPTSDTFYVTAGFWGDSSSATTREQRDPKQLTRTLKVSADGAALESAPKLTSAGQQKPGGYNTTGAWAQVAKTTDGGATWSIVFEDF